MAPAKKPTKKSNSAKKMKNNRKTEVKKSSNIKKKTTVGKALELLSKIAKKMPVKRRGRRR